MKIAILGTEYEIKYLDYTNDGDFKKRSIDGYCDLIAKKIVVCNMSTYPGYEENPSESNAIIEKNNLRHEIMHAFLYESGLSSNSGNDTAWSENEEMVDWIALQFPKILTVFREVGCI